MINYEKHKCEIDAIRKKGHNKAVDRKTNKVVSCNCIKCDMCLFYTQGVYNNCQANAMKWAASEYIEPEVDWSIVPVDTPVLISEDGVNWLRRYFAGMRDGKPLVYSNGATSWSANKHNAIWCRYIKLAELPDSPETEE